MAERPFITCHVLDTTTGKPGANIAVTLRLLSPANLTQTHWTAQTNTDGRVPTWTSNGADSVNDVVSKAKAQLAGAGAGDEEQMLWSLTFETEAYFGKGRTFWPVVELRFAARGEEAHYHVPLLLGPWSYTTYRGS
ncbi:hypothetical protein BDY17DRAFT_299163 [Neohortaea acidophila]|uniref:5-hydroxyisourate hydrolase n=1 Tax=Neohortaea acidophila TaxID=245834 RepID=A0A6A6PSX0_9PEZI|nr:uncharacterized protein BDY17DRAFT_299163 [Neohortaea acidophila]KAF2482781.1 hypothetical protein BDY17DRAFT_299163 [Neohortaea acidophila]